MLALEMALCTLFALLKTKYTHQLKVTLTYIEEKEDFAEILTDNPVTETQLCELVGVLLQIGLAVLPLPFLFVSLVLLLVLLSVQDFKTHEVPTLLLLILFLVCSNIGLRTDYSGAILTVFLSFTILVAFEILISDCVGFGGGDVYVILSGMALMGFYRTMISISIAGILGLLQYAVIWVCSSKQSKPRGVAFIPALSAGIILMCCLSNCIIFGFDGVIGMGAKLLCELYGG